MTRCSLKQLSVVTPFMFLACAVSEEPSDGVPPVAQGGSEADVTLASGGTVYGSGGSSFVFGTGGYVGQATGGSGLSNGGASGGVSGGAKGLGTGGAKALNAGGAPASAGALNAAGSAGALAGGVANGGGPLGSGGVTSSGGAAPTQSTGECCANGDCLCHGPAPQALSADNGPFKTKTFTISTGTVHYPVDAEPPFAALALCGGFLNTGPEMEPWGPFYASWGIVLVITTTTGLDFPDVRAQKLLASIDELKAENTKSGSPLNGKLAGRYGTSGYSMGGGGTTLAAGSDPSLRTSIGLAPWAPTGDKVRVPTLLLCGDADTVAPCSMANTAYNGIAAPTPKMMVTVPQATHFSWFSPTSAGSGISGQAALAFQKLFLEGDERWKPLLAKVGGKVVTNVQ